MKRSIIKNLATDFVAWLFLLFLVAYVVWCFCRALDQEPPPYYPKFINLEEFKP